MITIFINVLLSTHTVTMINFVQQIIDLGYMYDKAGLFLTIPHVFLTT